MDYTIPSDNRELQREDGKYTGYLDYTIPSDNRELQQSRYQDHILAIIPYQVITGNYNEASASIHALNIIPYQVITGNYNNHGIKIVSYRITCNNGNQRTLINP